MVNARRNIQIDYTGPQSEVFEDFVFKHQELYRRQFEEYNTRGVSVREMSRIRKETITMEVPADRAKRLKYLLVEASKLVEGSEPLSVTDNLSRHTNLEQVLNYGSQQYRLLDESAVALDVKRSFVMMDSITLNNLIVDIANLFVDSIVEFGSLKLEH